MGKTMACGSTSIELNEPQQELDKLMRNKQIILTRLSESLFYKVINKEIREIAKSSTRTMVRLILAENSPSFCKKIESFFLEKK